MSRKNISKSRPIVNKAKQVVCRSSLLSDRNVRCCVACCRLVSHGEYADGTDIQTDGGQTVTLRFLLDAASAIIRNKLKADKWLVNWKQTCQPVPAVRLLPRAPITSASSGSQCRGFYNNIYYIYSHCTTSMKQTKNSACENIISTDSSYQPNNGC